MHPIIFLDVDGVLVTTRGLTDEFEVDDPSLVHHPLGKFAPIERALALNLVQLVSRTQARIVISSTWRAQVGGEDMQAFLEEALRKCGLQDGIIVGGTPRLNSLGRGAEICAWLDAHPAPAIAASEAGGCASATGTTGSSRRPPFVILDDSHLDSFKEWGLEPHVVQTLLVMHGPAKGMNEGLTDAKMEEAVVVLHKQQPPPPSYVADQQLAEPSLPPTSPLHCIGDGVLVSSTATMATLVRQHSAATAAAFDSVNPRVPDAAAAPATSSVAATETVLPTAEQIATLLREVGTAESEIPFFCEYFLSLGTSALPVIEDTRKRAEFFKIRRKSFTHSLVAQGYAMQESPCSCQRSCHSTTTVVEFVRVCVCVCVCVKESE